MPFFLHLFRLLHHSAVLPKSTGTFQHLSSCTQLHLALYSQSYPLVLLVALMKNRLLSLPWDPRKQSALSPASCNARIQHTFWLRLGFQMLVFGSFIPIYPVLYQHPVPDCLFPTRDPDHTQGINDACASYRLRIRVHHHSLQRLRNH